MGTNEEGRPRSLDSRRDIVIYSLGGVLFAVLGVVFLLEAEAWYLVLGACVILVAAALWVARAITLLRTDEYAAPE